MSSTDSETGSDWEGEAFVEVTCRCLFCKLEFEKGAEAVLDHCAADHDFDVRKFLKKKGDSAILSVSSAAINSKYCTQEWSSISASNLSTTYEQR